MASGIFAVANIGPYQLYVGAAGQLQHRWPPLMQQLNQGTYGHTHLEAAWRQQGNQRRFTFHTAADLTENYSIIGLERFLADIGKL